MNGVEDSGISIPKKTVMVLDLVNPCIKYTDLVSQFFPLLYFGKSLF